MNTSVFLAAQAAQGGGSFAPMLMLLAIFVIMWIFMFRPQQQRQKKIREFQNSLTKGTKVVVGGGIYGTVRNIDVAKNVVEVEIAKDTGISVDRGYVFADTSDSAVTAQK